MPQQRKHFLKGFLKNIRFFAVLVVDSSARCLYILPNGKPDEIPKTQCQLLSSFLSFLDLGITTSLIVPAEIVTHNDQAGI